VSGRAASTEPGRTRRRHARRGRRRPGGDDESAGVGSSRIPGRREQPGDTGSDPSRRLHRTTVSAHRAETGSADSARPLRGRVV